ncbi:MAG: hypothetical protein ACLFQV_08405 [Vulcanimicrobiota bacterium]
MKKCKHELLLEAQLFSVPPPLAEDAALVRTPPTRSRARTEATIICTVDQPREDFTV